MKSTRMLTILVLALGLMVCFAQVSQAAPMGTAITYQGRLMDKNKPADGLYDFQFKLYDSNDPCTGTQLASPIDINDLDVIDGHFVVELDFGSDVFDGNSVWLETRVVRSPMGSDPATLSPLVELTPTPYALYAERAGGDNDWRVSGDNMYAIPSGTVSVSQSHDAAGPGLKVSRGFAPPMLGNARTEIDATSINAYFTSMGTSGTALKLNDESAGNVVLAEGGGNVGIGTTNPLSKLSVGGDGIANIGVYGSDTTGVYGSGSTYGVVGIDSDTGSYGRLGYFTYGVYGNSSDFGGYFIGKGYFSGNVGIGTRYPDQGKLEVNGEISTGHGGLRWKLYQGTTRRDYVIFSHHLDASKIYSISCVLRNGADGKGIAQECEGLGNILNQFRVDFDKTNISITNIGGYYDDDDDTYRCIVWYVDDM